MTEATSIPTSPARPARLMRTVLAAATLIGAGIVATTSTTTSAATAVSANDWLGTVNAYRAMSGLQPVSSNSTWSSQGTAHSCYMLQNGISHDEVPGNPGYTSGGDIAGNSGNVAVSSSMSATARNHIDLWMTGPFHAIGILRHSLRTSGFGICAQENTPTPWRSGGTLDVIRGIDSTAKRPSTPTLFPGNGATVPLHSFITEYPNPLTMCGWTGAAGLPLIAMMPSDVSSANSTLVGPNGPIETCTLHRSNVTDATARSILAGDNAIVVMPREPLADGTYTATVNTNAGTANWSFNVDRDAPLSAGSSPTTIPEPTPIIKPVDTAAATEQVKFEPVVPYRLVDTRTRKGASRLRSGKVTTVKVAGSDVDAVSANFVAVNPADHGYLTAYNCTTKVPVVSTLNYRIGDVVANQAVVPLEDGKLCLYSSAATDVVIDVNGFFRTSATTSFSAATPDRLYDSRARGNVALQPGKELVLKVAGDSAAAPSSTTSVALNVTVDQPVNHGYLRVYPCGTKAGKEISTVNYRPLESRPNSVVVPVDSKGRICISTLVATHVIVDYMGYFSPKDGLEFLPLDPIRLFDSRVSKGALNETTGGGRVAGGREVKLKVAGTRGVPKDATAVAVNVTATDPLAGTYVTAYPCGKRPATSTVNLLPQQGSSANGAMVKLSKDGDLCLWTLKPAHIIVDINGAFV